MGILNEFGFTPKIGREEDGVLQPMTIETAYSIARDRAMEDRYYKRGDNWTDDTVAIEAIRILLARSAI